MTATPRKRTADDKPYDFNLDAVESEVDLAPFRLNWNGKRWEFTHAQLLDSWDLVEAAEKGGAKENVELFRMALGEKQYDEFRKIGLPQYKMNALLKAYLKYCGIELGESQGSTNS